MPGAVKGDPGRGSASPLHDPACLEHFRDRCDGRRRADRPVQDLARLQPRRRYMVIKPGGGRAPCAELPSRRRVYPGLEVDAPDARPRRANLDIGPDRRQLRRGGGFGELRHGSGQLARKGGDGLGWPTVE
jgi:hypothetical protein